MRPGCINSEMTVFSVTMEADGVDDKLYFESNQAVSLETIIFVRSKERHCGER